MMFGVLIVAAACLGQIDAPVHGVVYEVYYTADGSDYTVYGTVHEVSEGHYEVILDEPWQASPRKFFVTARNMVDLKKEDATHRQRRHEEGWREAGYVLVDTPYGSQAVPRADAQLAELAQAMADAAAEQAQPAATPTGTGTTESLAGPALWVQWWPHAIIALVTLLLLAAIAATLIFR